jgi:predicted permease
MTDLRFAFRQLLKYPGFTAVAVLTLALGIGGNTAMFSLVNALMLRPLDARKPHELVGCYNKDKAPKGGFRPFSYPNYVDIRDRNTVFSNLLAFDLQIVGVSEGETTRRVFAALASANYFSTFGVKLAHGRDFLPAEEKPGSAIAVAILSHQYWTRHGSDPAILGTQLRINGKTFEIVGVAPEHFTGTATLFTPDLYLPLGMYETAFSDLKGNQKWSLGDRDHHCLMLVGRLKPGLTVAAAEAQLQTLASQMEKAYPEVNKDQTLTLAKLPRLSVSPEPQRGSSELSVLCVLLMSLSGVVLLIVCLNLANLLLARGAARRKEIAVRLALGGGRMRIVRQLLTEGLLLSLLGGGAGLVLAYWGTDLLVTSLASQVSHLISLVFQGSLDVRILVATLAFCVLAMCLFGLGPAWRLSRHDVVADLKEQTGEDRRERSGERLLAPRNLMVISQLALSLALVTAAGLFIRGASKAGQATPGYDPIGILLAEVDPGLARYDETRGQQLYAAMLGRLRGMPGVASVSLASCVPFAGYTPGCSVKAIGPTRPAGLSTNAAPLEASVGAIQNIIGKDYFRTLGLPLLRGRDFDRLEAESGATAKVAIIDESLARKLWPEENPLGRHINVNNKKNGQELEMLQVVGVAPGLRHDLFDKEPRPHVYVPFGQQYRSSMHVHLRLAQSGREAEAAMLSTVRKELRALDEQLPVLSLTTLRRFHDQGPMLGLIRTGASLFCVFGALAIFLAVVGVYGIKAYVVARRTREIGIRMALGATTRDVLWLVLREGLALTLISLGLGMFLALGTGRILSSMLYDVRGADPIVLLVGPLVLATAAMLACYVPARRAAKIKPMMALRYE